MTSQGKTSFTMNPALMDPYGLYEIEPPITRSEAFKTTLQPYEEGFLANQEESMIPEIYSDSDSDSDSFSLNEPLDKFNPPLGRIRCTASTEAPYMANIALDLRDFVVVQSTADIAAFLVDLDEYLKRNMRYFWPVMFDIQEKPDGCERDERLHEFCSMTLLSHISPELQKGRFKSKKPLTINAIKVGLLELLVEDASLRTSSDEEVLHVRAISETIDEFAREVRIQVLQRTGASTIAASHELISMVLVGLRANYGNFLFSIKNSCRQNLMKKKYDSLEAFLSWLVAVEPHLPMKLREPGNSKHSVYSAIAE